MSCNKGPSTTAIFFGDVKDLIIIRATEISGDKGSYNIRREAKLSASVGPLHALFATGKQYFLNTYTFMFNFD